MAEEDDLAALAGEYVLGTMPADERRQFARRMAGEPLVAQAVAGWQERFAPLMLALPEVAPPPGLLPRIEASLHISSARPAPANDNRVQRWQLATAAAAVLAVIAGGLALRPKPVVIQRPVGGTQQVMLAGGMAALSSQGTEPAIIITYNRATRRLKLIPVNMPKDALHSFQLWALQGKSTPKPLGLIDPAGAAQDGPLIEKAENLVFAVSQEPVGGSRTGFPTGKIMWSGKLVTVPSA